MDSGRFNFLLDALTRGASEEDIDEFSWEVLGWFSPETLGVLSCFCFPENGFPFLFFLYTVLFFRPTIAANKTVLEDHFYRFSISSILRTLYV
jgi:hypothetical protein